VSALLAVAPFENRMEYGATPPFTETVAEPLHNPEALTLVVRFAKAESMMALATRVPVLN